MGWVSVSIGRLPLSLSTKILTNRGCGELGQFYNIDIDNSLSVIVIDDRYCYFKVSGNKYRPT